MPPARLRDRVYFSSGNPWPQGHAVKEAYLDGSLYGPDRLDLNLRLETVDYRENDGGTFDSSSDVGDTDWGSKIVWNNYHRFSVGGAVFSATRAQPASIASLAGATFHIDPLPEAYGRFLDDELSFTAYILGHDAVADHRISFGLPNALGYEIQWQARIALSYAGEDQFCHGFEVTTCARHLSTIDIRCRCSDTEAQRMLDDLLVESANFTLEASAKWPRFILQRS